MKIYNKILISIILFFVLVFPVKADNLYYSDTNGTASYHYGGTPEMVGENMTVMYWYRLLNSSDIDHMIKVGSTSGSYKWQLYFSRLGISSNGTSYTFWSSDVHYYVLNEWHHFAITFDGITANAYLDGELSTTTQSLSGVTMYTGGIDNNFYLNNSGSGSYVSDANWDDFKYYSRALTEQEVLDEYNCAIQTPYDDSLEMYVDFDDQDGADRSINNYNLIEVNSPNYYNTSLAFTDICIAPEEPVEPTATTTADLYPCEIPDNILIQRITGCQNTYIGIASTTSSTTDQVLSETRFFYYDIPIIGFLFIYLLGSVSLSIFYIYIFMKKRK